MNTDLILTIVGTGGFFTVITAIVGGYFQRKKLGSEATEIITRAATGVVGQLQAEIERLNNAVASARTEAHGARQEAVACRAEISALRSEADMREQAHLAYRRAHDEKIQEHVTWDYLAQQQHPDLPQPPPLYPINP